jgi:hypothetical protein
MNTVLTDSPFEEARKHAESLMASDWDRKDHIHIGVFYKHFLNYIESEFHLLRKINPAIWDYPNAANSQK